jgi:hypothetical protein
VVGPTSLKRGEGLVSRRFGVVALVPTTLFETALAAVSMAV